MRHFVVYDAATGEIAYCGQSTADEAWIAAHWPGEGQAVAMLPTPVEQQLYWVENGVVVPRSPMTARLSTTTILADGESEAVLSGLPDPCVLDISGAVTWGPGEVTGGTVILTSTQPGRLLLRVTAGPGVLPWEGHVDAA